MQLSSRERTKAPLLLALLLVCCSSHQARAAAVPVHLTLQQGPQGGQQQQRQHTSYLRVWVMGLLRQAQGPAEELAPGGGAGQAEGTGSQQGGAGGQYAQDLPCSTSHGGGGSTSHGGGGSGAAHLRGSTPDGGTSGTGTAVYSAQQYIDQEQFFLDLLAGDAGAAAWEGEEGLGQGPAAEDQVFHTYLDDLLDYSDHKASQRPEVPEWERDGPLPLDSYIGEEYDGVMEYEGAGPVPRGAEDWARWLEDLNGDPGRGSWDPLLQRLYEEERVKQQLVPGQEGR